MKFTELVNTELSKLTKVTYEYNWNNIRKKIYDLEEGEVVGSADHDKKGPQKIIDG